MEKTINLQVPMTLRRRTSARLTESGRKPGACSRCVCHSDEKVLISTLKPRSRRPSANLTRKRKRTSEARPDEHPDQLMVDTTAPSTSPCAADLPVLSTVAPGPQPSTAPLQLDDGPIKIHNLTVEEYQHIYHEVVDEMLKYPSGRRCPYSLELGRRIKHRIWERLNRPSTSESVREDGRVDVDMSYGVGSYPPLYVVDISQEPEPEQPKNKSGKTLMNSLNCHTNQRHIHQPPHFNSPPAASLSCF